MSSPPASDIAVDVIVIPANRPKLARQCLRDFLCVGIFGALLVACYTHIVDSGWPALGALIGFAVFVSRFVGVFSRYIFNCPAMVLTREGILDGSYFTIFPLMRWQTICKIATGSNPLSSLEIYVEGSTLPSSPSSFSTCLPFHASERRKPHFVLPYDMIPGTADELLQQIQSYCADYHIGQNIEFVREGAEP